MGEGKKQSKGEQAKCPKCESELHYVEKVGQHYCFSCEDYFTLVETPKPELEKVEEAKPEPAAAKIPEKVDEKPAPAEKEEICPKCREPVQKMADTDRYYCYSCERYLDEEEKEEPKESAPAAEEKSPEELPSEEARPAAVAAAPAEEKPAPAEETKDEVMEEVLKEEDAKEETRLCQMCSNELVYVQKYDRWYCSKCRKYEKKGESKKQQAEATETMVCPACGKNATWIAKYERWYCYACKKYVPKEQKAEEKKAEPAPAAKPMVATVANIDIPLCPLCGKPAVWIEKYERYYCYPCQKYVPKAAIKAEGAKVEAAAVAAVEKKEEPKAPACPDCGKPGTWIEKYERYYCHPCKKYLPKDATAKPSVPLCESCGKPTTFVEKYGRYYCYPCKKYAPKETE